MYKIRIKDFDLEQNMCSGQCFRWNKISDDMYDVIAFGKYLTMKQDGDEFTFSCTKEEFDEVWSEYFDLETDYGSIKNNADERDEFMSAAVKYGAGIRILRQEFFEALISFLISQRKSIPAIRTSIERICEAFGEKIADRKYAFPTPERLRTLNTEEREYLLNECGLGYRGRYILQAAEDMRFYEDGCADVFSGMSYEEALKSIMNFNGAGVKVANCVVLFSLHKLNACPVDVWIQKMIDEEYQGVKPAWMEDANAGIYQQYAFFYKRGKRGIS